MSPSEADLRAALRSGEGEGPDVDATVAAGRAAAAQRRVRLLSGAAVAVVVACAGVGTAVLTRGGGSSRQASITADAAAGGSAYSAGSTAGLPRAALRELPCPATMPHYLLPGGGSPGQFGSSGPLFSKPVATVVVCSYREPARPAQRLQLAGDQARRLAASLDQAPTTRGGALSPREPRLTLAVVGYANDGTVAGTVEATLGAAAAEVAATNGTAIRYGWTPPPDLRPALDALAPK